MSTSSHSESRCSYSWWWDSHISPKNSKWLQENLTDMDSKVKSMIKLIEEDADSFARRAEMFYKKRPELMELVEEFYRAYRALAERYNHAAGELRYAHRTIVKAFADQQLPFELVEDSPSKSPAHDYRLTPESTFPVRALFKQEDELLDATDGLADLIKKGGSKNLHEMSNENQNLKYEVSWEAERAGKAELEAREPEKFPFDMRSEKEDVLLKYQQCLAKLMSVEKELKIAKEDSVRLDEKAVRAEIEVEALKEALIELEAEKKAGFVNHKEYLDKISNLEKGLKKLAIEAESEARTLKDEISKLELAKETVFNQYKKCLGNIAVLENIVSVIGNEAKLLKKKAEKAENEVFGLKKSLDDTNKEKEATAIQHKCCLEKMSELEREILGAKEDVKHFNNDMMIKNLKLKTAEEKCTCLETLNLSLKTEAEKLAKEIATKDQEFTERQVELENLMTRLEDEHFRHSQIGATLQTLQNLHSRTQDDQRALVVELKDVVRKLKGSEADKKFLEDEIRHVHDENRSLSEKNMSSAVSVENMQNEILELSEIKERLDREVSDHVELSNSIQKEILRLKEEINGLNKSYQMIVGQIEAAGLSPKSFGTNIKCLQGENLKLRQQYEKGANENGLLSKKLENMQELFNKNVVSEISVAGMKIKLEKSREEAKALQESYQFVEREKATLVTEKAYLLSQLETITETMQKLLEKNAILEKSLSTARVELEGLREKSKGLEEICELLKYERSFLLTERGTLASKLEIMEKRLKSVERRYNVLEKRYAELEKQKKAVHCQFEELKVSLSVEKQERMKSQLQSENKLAALKDKIHFLQEENSKKKNEFEEELEKSLKAQFEISILQKFIKDVEEKKYSFVIECQKHVDASKLAEKLIFELESESLEQQVESELLLDEIEQMRLGVYQIFKTLEPGPDCQDKIENEQTLVHRVLGNIEDLKCNVRKHEDEKQLLLVENSVLLTLLEQLESKGMEIELQKVFLENEYKTMGEKLEMAKNEKDKLLEFNGKLKSDVNESNHHVAILEAEMEDLCIKQVGLRKGYVALEEMYLHVNCDNEILMKKFCDLKEEKCFLDQHNEAVLMEYLATANQSAVLCDFGKEKIKELNLLLEALNKQHEINSALELEMSVLMKKMELQKAEILLLNDCVDKLEREMQGMKEYNDLMKKDIVSVKECLLEKEGKLLDTEVKLGAAENLNLKLCLAVDELENDVQSSMRIKENLENNILELSEKNFIQQMEIEGLSKVKTELESEISQLRDEINEKTIREQILSSKLQEKNNEFELWEAGASFYFDLQISSVEEILFQHKLRELSGLCRILQDENASKTSEIEELKGKICSMESEISGLNSQIYAYAPVVAALTDDISSLEHTALVQTKLKSSCIHELESSEADADPRRSTSEILPEDHSIVSLQNLRTRIKAFGKLMEEKMNKPTLHRRPSSKKHNEHSTDETEHSKPIGCLGRDKHDTPKIQKIKTKPSSVPKNGLILMKDIPLDRISNINVSPKRLRKRANSRADEQMLELLWDNKRGLTIGESLRMSYKLTEKDIVYDKFETAIKRYSDPPSMDSEFGIDKLEFLPRKSTENERRILERLSSDAAKLENLQMTVQILRENLATDKKNWKSKNVDFETVWEQLLEAEDTVEYLVDLNGQLVRNIENCPSLDRKSSSKLKEAVRIRRRKVSEQARKGSERIGRLQLELQKIQYILMKMEEEKKNKGKNMFFRSRSVVLRDFIYNGRKNSGKRKKGPLCGCFRPSNSRNGRST